MVIVVSRFVVPDGEADVFVVEAEGALAALGARPGFVRGRVGRCTDEPDRWLLCTEWDSVGSYRRSLSGFDVKVAATPLMARALPEPSAYEIVAAIDDSQPPVAGPAARARGEA